LKASCAPEQVKKFLRARSCLALRRNNKKRAASLD
jgi:hypothetical protein